MEWRLVDLDFPGPGKTIEYHYEFQPIIHDTIHDRLVQLKGDNSSVDVCAMVYHPTYDVCVALIPSRFSGPMQTFLYRFDLASTGYR